MAGDEALNLGVWVRILVLQLNTSLLRAVRWSIGGHMGRSEGYARVRASRSYTPP